MRLCDLMHRWKLNLPRFATDETDDAFNTIGSDCLDKLPASIVVDATNVADYYETLVSGGSPIRFPDSRPTHPLMWIEYGFLGRGKVGVLMEDDAATETTTFTMALSTTPGQITLPFGMGRIIGRDDTDRRFESYRFVPDVEDYMMIVGRAIAPAMLTLSFMNCRNVAVVKHTPPVLMPRQARACDKPYLRFHTLDISPMKHVLSTEGNVTTNGLEKALHICRGHFAHYTEDKPLFGKYSGRFWIPSCVKGNGANGIVVKDYKVKP